MACEGIAGSNSRLNPRFLGHRDEAPICLSPKVLLVRPRSRHVRQGLLETLRETSYSSPSLCMHRLLLLPRSESRITRPVPRSHRHGCATQKLRSWAHWIQATPAAPASRTYCCLLQACISRQSRGWLAPHVSSPQVGVQTGQCYRSHFDSFFIQHRLLFFI